MRGKRKPSTEPVTARMRVVRQGRFATGRALNCASCWQPLPTLTYLPLANELDRESQRAEGGISPNDLYIDWREMPGWRFDGETLRPTENARERRHRTEEKVRTSPRADSAAARQKLATSKGLIPYEERQRQGGRVGFPTKRPAPRRIECPQCHVENLITHELTERRAAE